MRKIKTSKRQEKKTKARRAPAPKAASTLDPEKTLVVTGKTSTVSETLKADGFSYSWNDRCWFKRGNSAALIPLHKKYAATPDVISAIQATPIKGGGRNPVTYRSKTPKKKAVHQLTRARLRKAAKANLAETKAVQTLLRSANGTALIFSLAMEAAKRLESQEAS